MLVLTRSFHSKRTFSCRQAIAEGYNYYLHLHRVRVSAKFIASFMGSLYPSSKDR